MLASRFDNLPGIIGNKENIYNKRNTSNCHVDNHGSFNMDLQSFLSLLTMLSILHTISITLGIKRSSAFMLAHDIRWEDIIILRSNNNNELCFLDIVNI